MYSGGVGIRKPKFEEVTVIDEKVPFEADRAPPKAQGLGVLMGSYKGKKDEFL